jgi:hypothetical protein
MVLCRLFAFGVGVIGVEPKVRENRNLDFGALVDGAERNRTHAIGWRAGSRQRKWCGCRNRINIVSLWFHYYSVNVKNLCTNKYTNRFLS